MIFISYVVRVV